MKDCTLENSVKFSVKRPSCHARQKNLPTAGHCIGCCRQCAFTSRDLLFQAELGKQTLGGVSCSQVAEKEGVLLNYNNNDDAIITKE